MSKLLAALFIAVVVQACLVLGRPHRDDDAQTAEPTQFPHQAWLSVKTKSGGQQRHCAGALISDDWVITSAACVGDFDIADVYLGTFYLPADTQDSFVHHTRSQGVVWSKIYDLALVYLNEPPKRRNHGYVASIRLPPKSYANANYSQWNATVSEYAVSNQGNEESQVTLVYSKARVDSESLCREEYQGFTDDHICLHSLRQAQEAEPCEHQVGSPLIVKEADGKATLLGIATSLNGGTASCGTVFTKIAPHLNWIRGATDIILRN